MSKELTPLQAFENIIETFWNQDTDDIKTVRNTLKDNEKLRQINCELLEQKNSLREELAKYKKAIEIIKTYYDIDEKGQLIHKIRTIWHKGVNQFDYELKEEPQEIEFLKEMFG